MKFSKFLFERFVNASIDDVELKEKYAQEVWDILQYSYAPIGGIRGSGFKNKEDMIKNIPFWKMARHNNKIVAVILYKDSNGRKSVALGTDGSVESKKKIKDMLSNDIYRSFGEKSKGALVTLMNLVPWEILKEYTILPKDVSSIIKKDIISVKDFEGELPEDGMRVLDKFPQLNEYAYMRKISGDYVFKVCFGITGKKIK